jgi:DNA-binding CsgD family transcriptional regulator
MIFMRKCCFYNMSRATFLMFVCDTNIIETKTKLRIEGYRTMTNAEKTIFHKRLCAFISHRYKLTRRENEILLGLVSLGLSNKELSEKLFISEKTMKNHMANIYQKLNIHSSRRILPLVLAEAVQYMKTDVTSSNFWQRTVPARDKEGKEERGGILSSPIRL